MRRPAANGVIARRSHLRLAAALALLAAAAGGTFLAVRGQFAARADEVTASSNLLRDGWDANETSGALTPATLASGSFGELFSQTLNGQIYAQPIVAGNTLIVATEADYVYGLNAATGKIKWQVSLGNPFATGPGGLSCSDLAPSVGVTGTPVYDPGTGTVYLVAQVIPPGHTNGSPVFYMEALDAQTGAEKTGWPIPIQGAPTNDPSVPFNPYTELQRPALLELNGWVYAAFGSHCDLHPYAGYVVGVNTTTQATTMWTDEAGVADSQAGVWQSGGGLMSDGPGQILFASGNGVSPAPGPGTAPPAQLAESVVRLAVQTNGTLLATDFFSPANAPTLDAGDQDLGSGGVVALPFGTTALSDLLVQAGKDGRVFLLNGANLGGREQGPGKTDAAVSVAGPFAGQWGHPAVYADTPVLTSANAAGANDYVYYLGTGEFSGGMHMQYLKATLGGSGGVTPELQSVAQTADSFGYTSGSPVVTSAGTGPAADSSAVVWVMKSSGSSGATGTLEAFAGMPGSTCTASSPCSNIQPLWTSQQISGASKFSIAATDSGRVYVGTRGVLVGSQYQGQVFGFGSPSLAPLVGASPVNFNQVAVGSAATMQALFNVPTTASGPINITSITPDSTGSPFAVNGPFVVNTATTTTTYTSVSAASPITLQPGDMLTVQGIAFTPTGPGGVTGTLALGTDQANFPEVDLGLSGQGTQEGFYFAPASLNFGAVPANTSVPQQITVTNGGPNQVTITSTPPSGGPFSVTGLPANSTTVAPGQSIPLTVTYAPTAASTLDSGSIAVTSTDTVANAQVTTTMNLSGNAPADNSALTPPTAVAFGSVPLGHQVVATLNVANNGNLPETITGTSIPTTPYGVLAQVAAGTPVNSGYDLEVPVTFTPTSLGAVTSSYQISYTDVTGTHSLSVPVTGTGVAPTSGITLPGPGGGWSYNGNAYMIGGRLVLTNRGANDVGSAVYPTPQPSDGLSVTFTCNIHAGTGGDGLTMSLLDPSSQTPAALGGSAGGLGFAGLQGVAVALVTNKAGTGYPSSNFLGIAPFSVGPNLTFSATNTKIPALRTGTHVVKVSVKAGQLTVAIDGKTYLSNQAVTLPPSVLVAFTGANGTATDYHTISGVSITSSSGTVPPPGGNWSFNGSAVTSGSDTVLTSNSPNDAGLVVSGQPVKTSGLTVTFDAQLGTSTAGTGGDGLVLALLDPAKSTTGSLGHPGPFYAVDTVPGIDVVLGTDHNVSGWPDADFMAIANGNRSTHLRLTNIAAAVPTLRGGTHVVTVTVTGSSGNYVVTVLLDGFQIIQSVEPLTNTVRLAFGAGTEASQMDLQIVRDVAISATG